MNTYVLFLSVHVSGSLVKKTGAGLFLHTRGMFKMLFRFVPGAVDNGIGRHHKQQMLFTGCGSRLVKNETTQEHEIACVSLRAAVTYPPLLQSEKRQARQPKAMLT